MEKTQQLTVTCLYPVHCVWLCLKWLRLRNRSSLDQHRRPLFEGCGLEPRLNYRFTLCVLLVVSFFHCLFSWSIQISVSVKYVVVVETFNARIKHIRILLYKLKNLWIYTLNVLWKPRIMRPNKNSDTFKAPLVVLHCSTYFSVVVCSLKREVVIAHSHTRINQDLVTFEVKAFTVVGQYLLLNRNVLHFCGPWLNTGSFIHYS